MFIRWKRKLKRLGRWEKKAKTLLYASLVESKRIDGKPRQKTVKYLGSIEKEFLEANNRFQMTYFWNKADKALEETAKEHDLTKVQINSFKRKLKAVVPRPTIRQIRAGQKELEKMMDKYSKI